MRNKHDTIRDVFVDPDIGDEILVDGEYLTVERIERHPGKVTVCVRINRNANRRRHIGIESWREYKDEAQVTNNRSIVEAFE